MKTEQLLCWSVKTDTEHSKTSILNEEEGKGYVRSCGNYQSIKLLDHRLKEYSRKAFVRL